MIPSTSTAQNVARVLLGGMLVLAGTGHLTFLRKDFQAQVPDFVPLEKDDTVLYSGVVEMALGTAIILAPASGRQLIGKIAAGFFAAVFPGNIAQYVHQRSAFGLDTNGKRLARLFFQPALIYWALKSTKSARS